MGATTAPHISSFYTHMLIIMTPNSAVEFNMFAKLLKNMLFGSKHNRYVL